VLKVQAKICGYFKQPEIVPGSIARLLPVFNEEQLAKDENYEILTEILGELSQKEIST
jgi:hypothetical protein